jgi:hypothetical protein
VFKGCSILVGLHPDEATEPILKCANALEKPFCIVPCCVFPTLHPDRRKRDDTGEERIVLSYDDLVTYLRQAGHGIVTQLPFEGRNTAVYRL